MKLTTFVWLRGDLSPYEVLTQGPALHPNFVPKVDVVRCTTTQKPSVLLVISDNSWIELVSTFSKFPEVDFLHVANVADAIGEVGNAAFALIVVDHQVSERDALGFLHHAGILQPNCAQVLVSEAVDIVTGVLSLINFHNIPKCLFLRDWNSISSIVELALRQHFILTENNFLKCEVGKLAAELAAVGSHSEGHNWNFAPAQQQGVSRESCELYDDEPQHSLGLCFRLISALHPLLGMQTRAVVEICRAMTRDRCFTDEQRYVLRVSSWIYAIGLVVVDKVIVNKVLFRELDCSDVELALFRSHPSLAQHFTAFLTPSRAIGETIRAHREHFDGSGYPDAMAGESIPWTARCLAVAVAFVECGLPKSRAAAYLEEQSGQRFDAEAVRLFFKTNSITELPANVREVLLSDLEVGMRLARGIVSPMGMLLIPEGHELDSAAIGKLQKHGLLNLVAERILIHA